MEMPTKNMFHKTNCQTVNSIINSSTLVKNTLRKASGLFQKCRYAVPDSRPTGAI